MGHKTKKFIIETQISAADFDKKTKAAKIKAGFFAGGKCLAEKTFSLQEGKQTPVRLELKKARSGQLKIGPPDADNDELNALKTVSRPVSSRNLVTGKVYKIPEIELSALFLHWIFRWCRTYVLRGYVLCPDGSPVPGAKVCAKDVDYWWQNQSLENLGCTLTDQNGAFEIKFKRCCPFYYWPWYKRRHWKIDPCLLEWLTPYEMALPEIAVPLKSGPSLNTKLFSRVLGRSESFTGPLPDEFDPERLLELRPEIVKSLPPNPDISALKIWPFIPFYPGWDCRPDVIFEVTQFCEGEEQVIVDEGYCETRWNVGPLTENIILTANENACCLATCEECPEGDCMVYTTICQSLVNKVGGNFGANPDPAGYYLPAAPDTWVDRPFSGHVSVNGLFGDGVSGIDYYEFEISSDNGATWSPLAPNSMGTINRRYYVGPPSISHTVPFTPDTIDGRVVYETVAHYEGVHGAKLWFGANFNTLLNWKTWFYPDGLYHLRLVGWHHQNQKLVKRQELNWCDSSQGNFVCIRVDNRITGPSSGHPASQPGHPFGPGLVHTQTLEPDTDIVSVKIFRPSTNEIFDIKPCDNQKILPGDKLFIDLIAYDVDGHLANFSLKAFYKENSIVPLDSFGQFNVAPSGANVVPPADFPGPSYAKAKLQGAVPPEWYGGVIRYEADAMQAFPEPCCYLLRLIADKRNIRSCHYNHGDRNQSRFIFGIEH